MNVDDSCQDCERYFSSDLFDGEAKCQKTGKWFGGEGNLIIQVGDEVNCEYYEPAE